MMKLYFENSKNERRIIGYPKTEDEAYKIIEKFCKDRNFRIYAIRSWINKSKEKVFDVGSHTEFFYLV